MQGVAVVVIVSAIQLPLLYRVIVSLFIVLKSAAKCNRN